MNKRIWLIASGVALIALLAGGMAFAASPSGGTRVGAWGRGLITHHGSSQAAPQGAEVIIVINRQTHNKFVDADGSGGPSVGDYFVFTEDIFEAQTHVLVGGDHARCMIDFDAFICDGTFTLFGRGDIAIETSLSETGGASNVLAVTGGTGEFLDTGGEAIFEDLQSGDTKFTFFLT
jgi:hypothetical protein